ncbi:CPCC family cysteine-rich protein [Streptomyces sp. NPDC001606]
MCPVRFGKATGMTTATRNEFGRANGRLSLTEARRNSHAMGACDERCTQFIRAPLPNEHPTV